MKICLFFQLLLLFNLKSMTQISATLLFGEKQVIWKAVSENNQSDILFLNVHEDELTTIEAVNNVAVSNQLNFWQLKHDSTRRIDFSRRLWCGEKCV